MHALTEHGCAAVAHDGPYVRKVNIDEARDGDDVGDALQAGQPAQDQGCARGAQQSSSSCGLGHLAAPGHTWPLNVALRGRCGAPA